MVRISAFAFMFALILTGIAPGATAQQDGSQPQDVQDRSQQQEGDRQQEETWLPSLITETPQEGFELAVMLARRGVATTQPDRDVLRAGRRQYAVDPDSLIAVSEVVALHFQTVAAANGYWRREEPR